jgi:penicillin-binding protein 2B
MKKKRVIKVHKPIVFIMALLFVFIIIKLCYVGLSSEVDGINLKEFASNRNTKEETLYASRGDILDKNGDVLATTVNSYTVIAYLSDSRTTNPNKPEHVVDKEYTAKCLSELLGADYDYILDRLNQNKYQVQFGSKGENITESLKNKIEALQLPGIDFIEGKQRNYKMSSFASYIVGYASNKDDQITGELGIESYYNKELSGKDGKKTYQTDAYGYQLPNVDVLTEEAKDGSDVYLTLDSSIQLIAENLVTDLTKEYDMDWLVFSVMDAKTGAILASSTYPTFNPNDLNTITSYMNPLVSYEYEPGSTMKIFSFASSMEEGKYNGQDTFKSGKLPVADVVISDFNKGLGWGEITYDTGFAYSSNVAASLLGLSLGTDTLKNYYKTLGFGSKTGIELANEVKGKINFTYKSELATASFGQGITVTPIQMLQALTTITNDGVMLKPYIVDKIVDNTGKVTYEGKRTELKKVYSKSTTDQIKKLMHDVVYDGLSTYWQPTKTEIAGKTGTAQIAGKGGYLEGEYEYIKSFAGIFPYDDPEYIVYIAIKRINTGTSNIAKEVTKAIDSMASYLGIVKKEVTTDTKIIELDNYISMEALPVSESLKEKELNVILIGDGKYIINQYPNKSNKTIAGSKVFLVTNSTNITLPNFTGWTYNEIKTYASLTNLKVNLSGYGYVTTQSIPEGTKITSDLVVDITLSS